MLRGRSHTATEREVSRDTSPRPAVIHSYPRNPSYRLSGSIPIPQPGDVARCGFVKRTPPRPALVDAPPTCVVCAHLAAAGVITERSR